MKNLLKFTALLLVIFSLSSCYINRNTVGNGPAGKAGETVKYSKQKQMYLFWGLMALKPSEPRVPVECGYQVKSSFNVIDAIVSTITGGIFSMRTVKVIVFKDSQCDPAIKRLEKKLEKKEMQEGK